jgi:hypothetical protein
MTTPYSAGFTAVSAAANRPVHIALPSSRFRTKNKDGTSAVVVVLGVLVLASPGAIPWLTVPGAEP